jgi:hypothetical protein
VDGSGRAQFEVDLLSRHLSQRVRKLTKNVWISSIPVQIQTKPEVPVGSTCPVHLQGGGRPSDSPTIIISRVVR